MDIIKKNTKSIIILVLVILGLVITVYLVKNPQIFKSRADVDALSVTADDGSPVTVEPGKFTTTSGHIKIGIQDLKKL